MAGFEPILYESEEVGKRMKSTKVRHTWMFDLAGSQHVIEYFDSRKSNKARVTLNDRETFKGKKQGSEFTIPLSIGAKQVLVVIKGAAVDLLINNHYFKHVLARLQQEPPRREEEFEPDFPDEPANPPAQAIHSKPAAIPPRPAEPEKPKAVKQPSKPKDPFEGARPEVSPPSARDIKPAVQSEDQLLSFKPRTHAADSLPAAFEKEVSLYPTDLFESAKSVPVADPLDDLFTSPIPVSQPVRSDGDLLGSTIKPAKPQAAQQSPSLPSVQPSQYASNPFPAGPAQPQQFSTGQPFPQGPAMPYMGPYMSGQMYMSPQGMMYMPQPMYMSPQGMMYVPPGALAMPMPGVIPAVRKDLELASPPNVIAGQSNNLGQLPESFTPHLGLIGPNPVVVKNSRLHEEPVVLQVGNPFTSAAAQDTTFSSDSDLHSVVDLSNLGKNMHSPPLAQRYQEQVRGVQVPGSDPAVPMKDLPKRS